MKMMKVFVMLVLTVMLATLLGGCLHISIGDVGKIIKGSGIIDSREVSLDDTLTGVENHCSIDVIIDPLLSGKAVIEGDDNLIEYVTLEQDNAGMLVVDFEPGINVITMKKMSVRIPLVNIEHIAVNGSGSVTQDGGTLKSENFDLRVYGSGSANLNIESSSLNVGINGSGGVVLTGSAMKLDAGLTGSGGLDGFGFKVQDAKVSVYGSGSADVYVSGALTGDIDGSGSIIYDGSPASVNVTDNGSGDVSKR